MQIMKLVALPSRTGRHLQRYNKGFRQVVGYVSYILFHSQFLLNFSSDISVLFANCLLNFPCGIYFLENILFLEFCLIFLPASANLCRCVPYRIRDTNKAQLVDDITLDDLEILLISSQKSTRLMFPKVKIPYMKNQIMT